MKTKLLLFYFLLFTTIATLAQNLVPNPSFEDTLACPVGLTSIFQATNWTSYRNTPDYFNKCNNNGQAGVPLNPMGYQYPSTGNAYAGFTTYAKFANNFREIIGIQLSNTLLIGQKYFLSFFINNPLDQTTHEYGATNKTGAIFLTSPYSQINPITINNFAHIYSDSVITDSLNWIKISGAFIADSAYQYLAIGNFFSDTVCSHVLFDSVAAFAYYYIDDICVSTDSNYCATWTGVKEITKPPSITISPNPTNSLLKVNGAKKGSHIKIYNTQGNLVLATTYTKNVLDVKSLAKGMYLLQIIDGDKSSTIKFVKQE